MRNPTPIARMASTQYATTRNCRAIPFIDHGRFLYTTSPAAQARFQMSSNAPPVSECAPVALDIEFPSSVGKVVRKSVPKYWLKLAAEEMMKKTRADRTKF